LAANLSRADPVKFDIPAQSAADALMLLAKQANVQVLFSHNELKNVKAPEVIGELEPADALAKLLAGTGYAATEQGPKKFLVKSTRSS
jgi:iron complex outermembrane receptor protein